MKQYCFTTLHTSRIRSHFKHSFLFCVPEHLWWSWPGTWKCIGVLVGVNGLNFPIMSTGLHEFLYFHFTECSHHELTHYASNIQKYGYICRIKSNFTQFPSSGPIMRSHNLLKCKLVLKKCQIKFLCIHKVNETLHYSS